MSVFRKRYITCTICKYIEQILTCVKNSKMEREYWVSLKDKNASGEVKQVAYVSPILKETGIKR